MTQNIRNVHAQAGPPRTFDLMELAWAAGYYDGEGCTFLNTKSQDRNKRYTYHQVGSVVVQCGDELPDSLARFAAAVRFGKLRGPVPNKSASNKDAPWKPRHEWRINGFEKTQALVAILWKFLSREKREQAKHALLEAYNHPNPGPRTRMDRNRREQQRLDLEGRE